MKKKIALICLICCIGVFVIGCGERTKITEALIDDFNSLIQEHIKEIATEDDFPIKNEDIELSYDEEYESYIMEYKGNIGGMFKVYNSDNQVLSEEERKSLSLTEIHILGACDYESSAWYAAELTGSVLIDCLDDSVNGYVDSINQYWDLYAEAVSEEDWKGAELRSKKYGKCRFAVTKEHSFIISFEDETGE